LIHQVGGSDDQQNPEENREPKVSARAGFCILGEMMNIITATKTIPASTT
jgi:hypothetical protein